MEKNSVVVKVKAGASAAAGAVGSMTKKAGEKAEVSRIHTQIESLHKQIGDYYLEIGKEMYLVHTKEKSEPDINLLFSQIDEAQVSIEELTQRSAELRGMQICSGCGRECLKEDCFCAKCGSQLEGESEEE